MKEKGNWKIKSSETIFKNSHLELIKDEVIRPNGEPGEYAVVKLTKGIAILPFDDEGNVYLTKQFRYAINKESIEAVAGGIEENEKLIDAAKRELKEELGIEAEEFSHIGYFDLDISMVNCKVELFTAHELKFTKSNQDDTEEIEMLKMKFEEAVQKVLNNEITHSVSCILILKKFVERSK